MQLVRLAHRFTAAPNGLSQLLSGPARRVWYLLWRDRQPSTRRKRRLVALHIDELEGRSLPSGTAVPVINLDPDAPSSSYTTTYYAGSPAVAVEDVTDATITGGPSATIASLTATLQNPVDGPQEILFADTTGTAIHASFAADRLSLIGIDTVADYQQVLRTITYQDQRTNPSTTTVRNILFVAQDDLGRVSNTTTAHVILSTATQASVTTIASAPNPSVYGQSVGFTATVLATAAAAGMPTGTVTFLDGSTVLGTATLSGGTALFATSALAAGSHSITAQYGGDATFQASVSVPLTQNVNPAVLTVTAGDATKVYGQSNPAFTYTIAGFVNGDTAAVVSGNASLSTTASTTSPVGPYPITAAQGSLTAANYTFVFVNGVLTVTPAPLTISAINTTKVVGQPNPTFTAAYSGFVNGDGPAVLGGTLTFMTTATTTSPAGPYPIMLGGLTSTNYIIAFVAGTLTVTAAPLSASATIVNSSGSPSAYGQTLTFTATVSAVAPATGTPSGTVTFVDGFNDLGTVALNNGTAVFTTATLPAGTHQITVRYSGDNSFTASLSSALTQVVNPAALTITANNASKVYGQANPALSVSYSGFANGDTPGSLNGTLTLSTPATASSPVGAYAITPSGLTSSNYAITFVTGSLSITPALLTVTANDAARLQGQADPTFTDSITGFVNGDTVAVVSGTASLTTSATISSGAGVYPITAAQGSLITANYTFAFVNGTLTILPVAAPVTTAPARPVPGPASINLPPASVGTSGATTSLPSSTASASATAAGAGVSGAGSSIAAAGNASAASASAMAVSAVAHSTAAHTAVTADTAAAHVVVPPAPNTDASPAPSPVVAVPPPPTPPVAVAAPPVPVPAATLSAAASTAVLQTDVLWGALDDFQPHIEHGRTTAFLRVGFVTGLVASAGYVILSARASYWLLTLLLARPLVWKRFDPIHVLFAWEKDKQRRAREEESLQSLVRARQGVAS